MKITKNKEALVLLSFIIIGIASADVVVNVTVPISIPIFSQISTMRTIFQVDSCGGSVSTSTQEVDQIDVLVSGTLISNQYYLATITDVSSSTITSTSTITVSSTLSFPITSWTTTTTYSHIYRPLPCDNYYHDYWPRRRYNHL